ncbi:MAG: RNA polymerase sigma factor [Candidatus Dojkabacteria bacterium]|nr:RNA polymerase sigma factor [Candidatus Dojkabacteria bacterium]MDQ7021867.1 RNA polymerase sigma factor [Candidatus Dojkabacteria bacterium]
MKIFRKKNEIIELERLFDKYFTDIYKFFTFKVQNKNIAEDLTSETFLRLAEIIKNNTKINNNKAFIYGIAKNVFLEWLKTKYKLNSFNDIENIDFYNYANGFINSYEKSTELEEIVKRLIKKLPKKQMEILNYRINEKLTLKEVREKIGKDYNYVKVTQRRAISNIKKLLATET